jgi:hypothetical protein
MVAHRACPKMRRAGRFFGRRVNCESVPLLPAWAVRCVLDDPRRIPYLLVWKRHANSGVADAVRVSYYSEPENNYPLDWAGWIEIKRADGTRTFVRTILRPLPRNGGNDRLIVCPNCGKNCRTLYGWRPGGRFTHSVENGRWWCRLCIGLRYRSEGTYRPRMFRFLGGYPRPEPWYPLAFSSPELAAELGLCQNEEGS